MSIKNLVMVASMLLAFGSVSAFAASHEKAEGEGMEAETMECITQEALDAMSDEDKAKVEAPVCEDDAAAATEESSEEKKAD